MCYFVLLLKHNGDVSPENYSVVITTLVYDTKHSVPFMTL